MTTTHDSQGGGAGLEQSSDGHHLPALPPEEPLANPGLPEHTWRPTDVDPKAEKRAERQVAVLFGLSAVCTVLFVVGYIALGIGDNHDTVLNYGASTVVLGTTLGGALLLIGIGIIQWARKLMADHEMVEMRHPARSSDEDREVTLKALNDGLEESGIARRPLVRNSLLGAVGLLGAPAIVLLRDLGPTPSQAAAADPESGGLERTIWAPGMRIVRDVVGTPIRASDLEIGDLVNAEPEAIFPTEENGYPEIEGVELNVAKSKAAVILLRMDPDEIIPGEGRDNWTVDGITCYSKICTHVGCPISLNERTTHHLLCPCHQSTFDLADSGRVIFGPAARHLPQLPIMVDDEGYLVAQSDFTEPVGPSYWERSHEDIGDQGEADL
ncbi:MULTISPECIES: ubiquinol-cytochrome c reductase iron-sulfur subunit [Nocardioides]|uniref:cytochrome bc1 complex Rieske iron-sulfur subunit n=1 Tax=Nocardioides TaxID=1839 RepID=UPI00070300B5|nr:ubiquinol-cytochrome C reductase [Nocardioides sp. Leaf285]KQQ41595.1 ubiquinol-cytochrome C reductase [Nocardioides sp. Leaf307]MBJ7528684.1 Rieske 2Fe-2S domain-containing protein [Nocardioides sp.]